MYPAMVSYEEIMHMTEKNKGAGFLITNWQEHNFCVEIAETQPHTERLERDMD